VWLQFPEQHVLRLHVVASATTLCPLAAITTSAASAAEKLPMSEHARVQLALSELAADVARVYYVAAALFWAASTMRSWSELDDTISRLLRGMGGLSAPSLILDPKMRIDRLTPLLGELRKLIAAPSPDWESIQRIALELLKSTGADERAVPPVIRTLTDLFDDPDGTCTEGTD
jgi:hypothetical protein